MVSRLRAVLGAEFIQGGRAGYRLAAGPDVPLDEALGVRISRPHSPSSPFCSF
jgi:hypothetical protein